MMVNNKDIIRNSIILFSPLLVTSPLPQEDLCPSCQCGPNSLYQTVNGKSSCACQPGFIGSPPNCRPECVSNSECASHLACVNRKCQDPCQDFCGSNTECRVVSHTAMCACQIGYTGDPFTECIQKQRKHLKKIYVDYIFLCIVFFKALIICIISHLFSCYCTWTIISMFTITMWFQRYM